MNESNTNPSVPQVSLPTQEQLKAGSLYAAQSNPRNGNKKIPSGKKQQRNAILQSKLAKVEAQNASLRQRESVRRENTPTVSIGVDSIDLVYTGKVAGKTANRFVPIVKNEHVEQLKPLLTPIVSILNAAVREKQLEELPYMDGKEQAVSQANEPVYRATALTRGKIAYEQLFANEKFVKKLGELAKVIDEIYQDGVEPKEVTTIARGASPTNVVELIRKTNPTLASKFESYLNEDAGPQTPTDSEDPFSL